MESTFVLRPDEFNGNFIDLVKKLFQNAKQLQITINESSDFGLLTAETNELYSARIEKALAEINAGENIVTISETDLDDLVLSNLK